MRQNLRLALVVAVALTLGPLSLTLYQYCTWLDVSTENHVELVQTLQVFAFGLLPAISAIGLVLSVLIVGALRRVRRRRVVFADYPVARE